MDLKKEWDEAREACDEALAALDEATSALKKASGWSKWDIFGGGIFSGMMKYRRMGDTEEELDHLKEALKRLSKELEDIHVPMPHYEFVGTSDMVFDLFFDNIYHDMKVNGQINRNLTALEELRDNLTALRERLESDNPFKE